MNSKFLRMAGAVALMMGLVCYAPAQDDADDAPAQKTKRTQSKPTVAKVLQDLDTFNAKPNLKAKYYVYLQSASWCGPCKAEMPDIVKAYPNMKKKKVEIILIGADRTKEDAILYLDSFKAAFPGVHYKSPGVKDLPGFTPAPGIPHATFVDDKGRVLGEGHGSIIMNWEQIIKNKPIKKR